MKILIVGAGILGASLAFRLGLAGAKVTVLEAATPAAGASGSSFGWINASFYLGADHHRLRVAAMAAHHRLRASLPAPAPDWLGTFWWDDQDGALTRMQAELLSLGYPVKALTRSDLRQLEPALLAPPDRALHLPSEGATDAAALTHALLAASGARVRSGTAATALILRDGRVTGVQCPRGPLLADHTILAAGTATPALLRSAGLDLPMVPRPGLILRSKPVGFRLKHILVTQGQEVRQLPDGSLLSPCAASHQAATSETVPDQAAAARATIANLNALFGQVVLAETRLAHRPVPADGLPVLGLAAPGLSLAVMHSGVTLGPYAAEALTAELLGQTPDRLWANSRPERLMRRL